MRRLVIGVIGAALLLAAGFDLGPATAAAAEKTAAVPNFAGRWKLNEAQSDKPSAAPSAPKDQTARKLKDATPTVSSAPSASATPPETQAPAAAGPAPEVTIRQTDVEIAAETKPGEVRSFYPNGKTYKADEGTADIKSAWKDGTLVFEKKGARGWKYTETWQLAPNGAQMRVDTRLEGGGQKTTVTKRIYDRVAEPAK